MSAQILATAAASFTVASPSQLWDRYGGAVVDGALALLGALVVLAAGLWIADLVARAVRRIAQRSARFDVTLGAFFSSMARYGIWAFTGIAVLAFFGIDTTSLVTVLGAATLAIGLALQGTLSNVAAGVMLVLFRPYNIGDSVSIAGQTGTVRDITLFVTELDTVDNVRVVLPNGQCWGAAISNYSANATRRVDLEFVLAFDADPTRASTAVTAVAAANPLALPSPEPFARFDKLRDYGAVLSVRVWVKTEDYLKLRYDLIETIPAALAKAGAPIVLPTSVSLAHNVP